MAKLRFLLLFIVCICFCIKNVSAQSKRKKAPSASEKTTHGAVVTEQLVSTILRDNKINIDPNRNIKVYLPPGYADSKKSYPVVYYLHNIFWSPEKMFEDGNLVKLIERGMESATVKEFIFVAADFSTPTTGSVYENSPVSGRWLDFIVQELVPFIDTRFRTLRDRDSRAVIGDFFGGRGALKLAMVHADVFSVAYALHPVATGNGSLPWAGIPIDWKKLYEAKSADDVGSDGRTKIFLTISQGFLPNLNRPPLYCDFFMEPQNGEPLFHVENTKKTKAAFHLDETLPQADANLRTMRGLALDWGRFDMNPAHVESNREFSRKLEDLGVEHEAEEYRGNPWNKTWTPDGRFYARVLPFINKHLVFEDKK